MENVLKEDLDHILSKGMELSIWEVLRNKNVFITGATGFFGCWLLESIVWANEQLKLNIKVLALTRNYEKFKNKAPHLATHPSIRFHIGDICDFSFPQDNYNYIIHAATESSTKINEENPVLLLNTIIDGTKHTLDFARKCGASKFLLTSSGAVYGKQPEGITHIKEDYLGAPILTNPKSVYGEGKRISELLCSIYNKQYGIDCKIARCFAFVGPYLPIDSHYAIGNFINDGLNGGPIVVNSDGTSYRSYLYAADLLVWLWTILFKGETCRPYNVGSEKEITIAELAKIIGDGFTPSLKLIIRQKPIKGKFPEKYIPSTQRARNELNLNQTYSLKESIIRTINYIEKINSRDIN